MRKQVRQYLRRSLCGVLSAAMILTGSAISGMTAYAAQPDVEDEGGGLAEGADVTPSEGDKDEVQNPGGGDNAVADDANGTGSDDSKQEGSDGQKQPEVRRCPVTTQAIAVLVKMGTYKTLWRGITRTKI